MDEDTVRALRAGLSRRDFLGWVGVAGGAVVIGLPGCGGFEPESGPAFTPWEFPADETRPEYLAVAAAILASSPHNTQPWRFEISDGRIDLFADRSRSLGPMDPLGREMFIGLGCALENLLITARHLSGGAEVTLLPDEATPDWVARVVLTGGSPTPDPLFEQIPNRHTNRGPYSEEPPPAGLDAALAALIDDPDVRLHFLSSESEKSLFREGTVAATRAINGDVEMSEASHSWYRHTAESIAEHRDGIVLDATGNGATTRTLGKSVAAPTREGAGEYWLGNTADFQTTAAAFCVLTTPDRLDPAQQLRCGRVYQRMQLWATEVGIAMHPINQMAERQDREDELGLPPTFTGLLRSLIGDAGPGTQMLFRVGYAWDEAFASPRRPLEWVAS